MPQSQELRTPPLYYVSPPELGDYELLDCGNGLKLERFGGHRLIRPEAEAIWQPALAEKEWTAAAAIFRTSPEENGGHWEFRSPLPPRWQMDFKGLKCWVETSHSRHLGVFPEQASQWDWIGNQVRSAGRPLEVLNLFGYTGLASLAAARAGAKVTHVDASRKVVTWGQENQRLSSLETATIRWLVDDVIKFVQRQERKQAKYDGIILDPPKFGRGPKGEVWEFYKLLPALLQTCRNILSPNPCFIILTAYAVKASALTIYYALRDILSPLRGTIEAGEIVLPEKSAGRQLSMAIFARWVSTIA